MPLTQAVADPLLNWITGTAMPTPPAALHMSLHSGEDADAANEVSAQLSGRVLLAAGTFTPPGDSVGVPGREIRNAHAIVFGRAGTDLSVKSFAVWDAPTGGQMLFKGDVTPNVQLRSGDPAVFSTNDLVVRFGPVA